MEKRCRCFDRYLVVLFAIIIRGSDGQQPSPTPFPSQFWGDWYSIDQGVELHTLINRNQLKNEKIADSECVGVYVFNDTIDAQGNYDGRILIYDKVAKCYQCFEMYHRTVNIVQYKRTTCITRQEGSRFDLDYICGNITPTSDILTMFRVTLMTVNCKTTWEGTFHFTYEVDNGGVCDSPGSRVDAFQEPGSVYVDNQVFRMYFGKCPDVSSSFNQEIRFQCMGTWTDPSGNIYSAMADIGSDQYKYRYRCMLTRNDQQHDDHSRYYSLSRWAECSTLKSPYDGPIRLRTWPGVYEECLWSLRNTVVYEGTQNTMLKCAAGPNGSAWSVRSTSNTNIVYQITNSSDVVSPNLTGLYAINQTGLIIRNATTNATGVPISTAGIYTVQFANSTNNIAAKLVVIRSGPICSCDYLTSGAVILSCTVIYADHPVAPIHAIMNYTVKGQVENTTITTRTPNVFPYVWNYTTTTIVNNTVPVTFSCQVTFAAPEFGNPPYMARNVPALIAACRGTTTTCTNRTVATPSQSTNRADMNGGMIGSSIGIAVGGIIVVWWNSLRCAMNEISMSHYN